MGPFDQNTNIVILTGAGISAESGLRTFRGPDGLWNDPKAEALSNIKALKNNHAEFTEFYNWRRRQLQEPGIAPNAAHFAIAELQKRWPSKISLVTQNVDNLHERAGSSQVIHMHGQMLRARCTVFSKSFPWSGDISPESVCPCCKLKGRIRPDIVLFGEIPYQTEYIERLIESCGLFICIGSSGNVYPAASLVALLPKSCFKIEMNIEKTNASDNFDQFVEGPASVKVPEILNML